MINKKAVITSLFLSLSTATLLNAVEVKDLVVSAQKEVKSINTKELEVLLKNEPNLQVIDVRTRDEINKDGGYIKTNNYTNISRDKLEFLIAQYAKKR